MIILPSTSSKTEDEIVVILRKSRVVSIILCDLSFFYLHFSPRAESRSREEEAIEISKEGLEGEAMKECELCNFPARMYCDSDQASLCLDCDAKVHSANFLVARHMRSLLCHVCQSPTPWKASGTKLGHSITVCERCVDSCNGREERSGVDGESEGDDVVDGEDDVDVEDEGDEDVDEDGDNQVVPWSSTPPPPAASSSSSDESFSSGGRGISESKISFSLKRKREDADLCSQDDLGCSSSQPNNYTELAAVEAGALADDEATSYSSFRLSKDRKRTVTIRSTQAESTSPAFVCSLKRFQKDKLSGEDTSAAILRISKLSKEP